MKQPDVCARCKRSNYWRIVKRRLCALYMEWVEDAHTCEFYVPVHGGHQAFPRRITRSRKAQA